MLGTFPITWGGWGVVRAKIFQKKTTSFELFWTEYIRNIGAAEGRADFFGRWSVYIIFSLQERHTFVLALFPSLCMRVCVCARGRVDACLCACAHIDQLARARVSVCAFACLLCACVRACVCVRVGRKEGRSPFR